ncbi:MAG: DNA mismatch repair endonuclease MutL [Prolixibacteraceae bacterium]|nr:DNA mismatch repair endonuclease MutL [Prolixibacteraceae bacterium]
MSDIIQLLPDSVANQIAAGEVIQRPASVVKELVENALDAGATGIIVHVKDAGKTLIKVVDNGCGMSPTDARMAFERHATSKIVKANDLFRIRTLGFRGEALPSVSAIADVELRTRRVDDEMGTLIQIAGSEVLLQEPASSANGTTITVKNLFFNVPARRKFLKGNTTELRHIINEIQRIAIPNPEISFSLYHNNSLLFDLTGSNYRRRIVDIMGKNINQSLVPVEEKTQIVNVFGYIGQPRYAKKTMGEQFFFVNRRYMRHPYFHKAVMQAYEKLLPSDTFPSYFLFLDVEPADIDINVHPTKTEIKFENDQAIWQILHAAVRVSLGKHNVVPSIDFDQSGRIEIPVPGKKGEITSFPGIEINPEYNPFEQEKGVIPGSSGSVYYRKEDVGKWENLYAGSENGSLPDKQMGLNFDDNRGTGRIISGEYSGKKVLQIKQRYILTPVKSGLMIIDQKRAHERIIFEKLMEVLKSDSVASQQQLFPQTIELDPGDAELLRTILNDLLALGFDIREFGKNTFVISGTPGVMDVSSPGIMVEKLLEEYKNSPANARDRAKEQVAISLARSSSLNYGTELEREEIDHLIDNLFACSTPNYSPDGKKVLTIISLEDIDKLFNK